MIFAPFIVSACQRTHSSDVVRVPPFVVEVRTSPRATARLAAARETIVVGAYLFGFPAPNAQRYADDMGEIHLGQRETEMPGPGRITFLSVTYDRNKLSLLRNRDLKLLINVWSGRRTSPNNLLHCSIFEDSFEVAAKKGVRIDCSLIEEDVLPNH